MAWCWELNDERYLIAVNFSDTPSQAIIRMPWEDLRGRAWRLSEQLSVESYDRGGDEMAESGLFRVPRAVAVALLPATAHFLIRSGHD